MKVMVLMDDLMTLTGSEKDIVSYFVKFMGANKI